MERVVPPEDTVVILGCGATRDIGLEFVRQTQCDAWSLNKMRFPGMTLLFDLHKYDARYRATAQDLSAFSDCPVMMQKVHADVPMSRAYPMEEVLAEFPIPYFNDTICYMLALAIQCKRYKRIMLAGVDYHAMFRPEQQYERPCAEFWLGMAAGRGIQITYPGASTLFTFAEGIRLQYGFEGDYSFLYTPEEIKDLHAVRDDIQLDVERKRRMAEGV